LGLGFWVLVLGFGFWGVGCGGLVRGVLGVRCGVWGVGRGVQTSAVVKLVLVHSANHRARPRQHAPP